MTAPITVDPPGLASTGTGIATEGETARGALATLSSALSAAGAPFGHDAAGVVFGQTYAQAGQTLLDAASAAVTASRKVAFGIQMSAYNYGRANAASTVGGGHSSVPQPSAPSAFTSAAIPPPLGGGIAAPLGWSLVESFVGDFWPDGNPAQLHAVAAGWRAFATAMAATAGPVSTAATTLGSQQIPEAGYMADATSQLGSGLTDIAAQAQVLATEVDAFAATVEATQEAIRGLLHQLSPGGVLETLGGLLSGENPWDKIKEIAAEIKTVLNNMKRQADASRTLFSQGINLLDSATNSLERWAHKEFIEAFGEDVGTILSSDFNALVDLPAGTLKFAGVTAEGLQQLDPMRFAYDPQGALDTWQGLAESTAVVTNPALLAEKVISDPQGSLEAVKGLTDWEDVENGHPFGALGYNAAQVGTFFVPGAGEAGAAADAASVEARIAGSEARVAGAGTREAAAAAGGRAASASEGVTARAGEIGSKLDDITVPEATGGAAAGGKAPVEAHRPPMPGDAHSPVEVPRHEAAPPSPAHPPSTSAEPATGARAEAVPPAERGTAPPPDLAHEIPVHGSRPSATEGVPVDGAASHDGAVGQAPNSIPEPLLQNGFETSAAHDGHSLAAAHEAPRPHAESGNVDQPSGADSQPAHHETGGTHDPHAADPTHHPDLGPGLSDEQRNEIMAMEKGTRPDPSEYLSPDYIEQHMAKFDDGATRFMPEDNFTKYGIAQRDGTSFVMARSEVEELLASTHGDPRALERALGMPEGFLDKHRVLRIDIPEPENYNARIPSGNEAGANDQWLPGGLLPDGLAEVVIDGADVPPSGYTISDLPE